MCTLKEAMCTLKEAVCTLKEAMCTLKEAMCTLKEAMCTLKEAMCTLKEASDFAKAQGNEAFVPESRVIRNRVAGFIELLAGPPMRYCPSCPSSSCTRDCSRSSPPAASGGPGARPSTSLGGTELL